MNVGRFFLSVIVAFIIYAALYTGLMMFALGDIYAANASLMRPESDGLAMLGLLGHFAQTIVVVLLFNMAVNSTDVGRGVRFGLLMGGYLAATDVTLYAGLKMSMTPLPYSIVIHLFVGAIIGIVLAKLHKDGEQVDAKET
jgi:hypothetical protein